MTSVAQLHAMDTDTLRTLNKTAVAILNSRMKSVAMQAASKLTVGQRVTWFNRNGIQCTGTVVKVKVKMVEVRDSRTGLWNVSATLLKAA